MTPYSSSSSESESGFRGVSIRVDSGPGRDSEGDSDPGSAPLPARAWGTIRKYANIARVTLVERMTYRADFFVSTIFRFLPLATSILLWRAVFAGAGAESLGDDRTGIGYTFNEMIAYLLLVQISRMFSSMPGLAGGVAREIRDGSIKRYLVQPLDMIGYLLAYRVAHKTAYIAMSALPYGLLFAACAGFFEGFPGGWRLAAYLVSLGMAFGVGFLYELCVGMAGFWILEVTSLVYISMTINFFVSGHMFPIDLLPPFWVDLFKWLPFQYMAYFPAAVFLGKVPSDELARGLAIEAGWLVGLAFSARWLRARGLRRYGAYGG